MRLTCFSPDGRAVHLLSIAVPLFDDAGRVRGMVSACADITQLKQAEEALRESEMSTAGCSRAAER